MVEFCDRIGIMYAGELVEVAPAKAILTAPLHPYTKGLGNSFPPLHGPKTVLEGSRHPAQPAGGAGGLSLSGPLRQGARAPPPAVHQTGRDPPRQQTACHLYEAQDEQQDPLIYLDKAAGCYDVCHANRPNRRPHHRSPAPLQGLPVNSNAIKSGKMRALSDITFNLHRGRALAVVGESGPARAPSPRSSPRCTSSPVAASSIAAATSKSSTRAPPCSTTARACRWCGKIRSVR